MTHVKLPAHEQGCKLKHAERGLVKGSSVPGVGRIEDPDDASFDPERSTDQAAPQPFPAPRERKEIRFPDVGYQQCGTAGENPAGNAFTTPYRSLQRSIWQKLGQLRAALVLEQDWGKAQIAEAYLNLAPFRGELVGIAMLTLEARQLRQMRHKCEIWSVFVDEAAGRYVTTVLNPNNGEVVRQIPADETLRIARNVQGMPGLQGLFVDRRA